MQNRKNYELFISLIGGRIHAFRCQALSKRSKLQCKNAALREKHVCRFHGGKSKGPLTIDHVKPKVHGGLDVWENLVTACKPCNQKKGDRTPELANMPLAKKPKRPNMIHYFQKFAKDKQNAWRPYVFMESFKSII